MGDKGQPVMEISNKMTMPTLISVLSAIQEASPWTILWDTLGDRIRIYEDD